MRVYECVCVRDAITASFRAKSLNFSEKARDARARTRAAIRDDCFAGFLLFAAALSFIARGEEDIVPRDCPGRGKSETEVARCSEVTQGAPRFLQIDALLAGVHMDALYYGCGDCASISRDVKMRLGVI